MLEFLPERLKRALSYLNMNCIYELRLRANKPTTVNYCGAYRYLGEYGLTDFAQKALICTENDISDCVFKAGNYSVYSVEEQLKRGYVTASCGERIGLAGEYVLEGAKTLAVRNINSLCVRIPHEIVGCAQEIYHRCMRDKVRSLLIASPPGLGKTTILRDLTRILCEKTAKNVLVCDERGEISAGNTGDCCDVMKFADKRTAFEAGVRAMRPDIIVTDELSAEDCIPLQNALKAGVTVVASAHFARIESLETPFIGIFERFVLLKQGEIGKIQGVYDEKGREIKE